MFNKNLIPNEKAPRNLPLSLCEAKRHLDCAIVSLRAEKLTPKCYQMAAIALRAMGPEVITTFVDELHRGRDSKKFCLDATDFPAYLCFTPEEMQYIRGRHHVLPELTQSLIVSSLLTKFGRGILIWLEWTLLYDTEKGTQAFNLGKSPLHLSRWSGKEYLLFPNSVNISLPVEQ